MTSESDTSKSVTDILRVDMISESEFTVQGHGVHTAFVEMTNALKARSDVDIVVNQARPDADIVHVQTVGLYSTFKLWRSGGKKVISGHVVPDSFVGSLKAASLWRPLAKFWLRYFYNKADLVLAVSDYTKQQLQGLGVKAPISTLYNTIDTAKYKNNQTKKQEARKKLGIKQDAFVVVGSGQVQPRKRVDVFVSLAKSMPDISFVWVGGIPFGKVAAENKKMQTMMKSTQDNLLFTGVIPLDSVADYYRAADVFLLPSEQETFGLVVIEAAAAGLPVVLRDIPDYNQTFRGDVLMGDDKTFEDIIRSLYLDPKLREKYKKAATRIAKRFDSQAGGKRLLELYRSILN